MGTEREALVFNNSVSESETQTDGTLPNLREGCMRAGGVEETDGGMCGYQEIPDPLTNIPRPSHENLPGLLPSNAAAALLARANCKSALMR